MRIRHSIRACCLFAASDVWSHRYLICKRERDTFIKPQPLSRELNEIVCISEDIVEKPNRTIGSSRLFELHRACRIVEVHLASPVVIGTVFGKLECLWLLAEVASWFDFSICLDWKRCAGHTRVTSLCWSDFALI